MPIIARVKSSSSKVVAREVIHVVTDQASRLPTTTLLRGTLSARYPANGDSAPYTHRKVDVCGAGGSGGDWWWCRKGHKLNLIIKITVCDPWCRGIACPTSKRAVVG